VSRKHICHLPIACCVHCHRCCRQNALLYSQAEMPKCVDHMGSGSSHPKPLYPQSPCPPFSLLVHPARSLSLRLASSPGFAGRGFIFHLFIMILINDGRIDHFRPVSFTSALFSFAVSRSLAFFHEGCGGFDAFFCHTAFPESPEGKLPCLFLTTVFIASPSSLACSWLSLLTIADACPSSFQVSSIPVTK